MNRAGTEPLRPTDPARIGPYRLLGRLGEGGMGTVYLALSPDERAVAVKVVKPELTVDRDFAARFHAEVANARRVASFCTAQVLGNGNTEDGRPYLVTEYIAGTPLSRQIAAFGALDAGPLHGVALGVAAALAAIHVAGLVHRDLKPSNVILSMSGPRVIDFGISRALDAATGFTRSGELVGSPGWWAPEQVRGDAITPAADIFAWGCLVAYAGSGRHPYGRGDALTLAARVLNSAPDLGTLPAPLHELVRRATDPDPARRPTAQELLIALVGGEAPHRLPVPDETATLVATEILSESWRPPDNVEDDTALPHRPIADLPTAAGAPTRPGTGRRPVRRWLLPSVAIIAALAATVVVLTLVRTNTTTGQAAGRSVQADDGRFAGERRFADGPETDVGRRVLLPGSDVQLLIPQPPDCSAGRCRVRLSLVNPGGTAIPIARSPRLIDDQGGGHELRDESTELPDGLAPGDKIDAVLVFDLPDGRRPAKLLIAEGIEVRL